MLFNLPSEARSFLHGFPYSLWMSSFLLAWHKPYSFFPHTAPGELVGGITWVLQPPALSMCHQAWMDFYKSWQVENPWSEPLRSNQALASLFPSFHFYSLSWLEKGQLRTTFLTCLFWAAQILSFFPNFHMLLSCRRQVKHLAWGRCV